LLFLLEFGEGTTKLAVNAEPERMKFDESINSIEEQMVADVHVANLSLDSC